MSRRAELEPPSLALDGEEREGGGNSGSVDSSRGKQEEAEVRLGLGGNIQA